MKNLETMKIIILVIIWGWFINGLFIGFTGQTPGDWIAQGITTLINIFR